MMTASSDEFDVLIIGGGITGCGVARDASMRGLRVVLAEREDFASGTSGRSSRLIHGGIRYLEHGQFHLVREAIRERQILLRIAPHLVKQLAFTWPIYRGARIGKLKLATGLFFYDLMARGTSPRHQMFDAAETIAREPSLEDRGLTGGAVYYDASTDDARLTVVNAIAARQHGAEILTHSPVTRILRKGARATGAIISDSRGGEREVSARSIVNATGVWSSELSPGAAARTYRGSKGVHIAVERARIGNNAALTLISPIDGRVMFCLPAGGQAIIGTTDTWSSESPESVRASYSDVEYLVESANRYFPKAALTARDVVSAWAGIRPLAGGRSLHPSAVSREHSITRDETGVIRVTGGKLTTYRSMAAEIVDLVQDSLGMSRREAHTDTTELPGGDREDVLRQLSERNPALSQPLVPHLPYTGADVVYAVQHEMAQTISDVLIRRTHLAFELRDHAAGITGRVADIIGQLLGWTAETKSARIRDYQQDVERIFKINSDAATAP